MRGRSKAGPTKPRRGKPTAPKRASGAKAARPRSSSAADNDQLARERDEALLREAANLEILRLISKSPGDVETVFRTILERATSICKAKFGVLDLYDGDAFHPVAHFHTPAALIEALTRRGPRPNPKTAVGRVIKSKQVVQIVDLTEDVAYLERDPVRVALVEVGARTLLVVPMLKEDVLVGAIAIYRQEKQVFTDKQIALMQNFAAQAVIAIENARLLNELRQSLEQQTATADVLRVISSSPGELEPVFQAMLENAVRICEAKFGALYRIDGEKFHFAAEVGTPLEFVEHQRRRGPFQPSAGSQLERVLRTKQVSQTDDATVEFASRPAATLAGARSTVAVPMLKDDVLIGAIFIYRTEVRPFTEKQIEVVKNFAAQAVVAIENTRLLNELRQRTADLSESLDQQTATSQVLKIISSVPGELKSVFDSVLSNATRICEATYGTLLLFENGAFRRTAQCNAPQRLLDEWRNNIQPTVPGSPLDRLLQSKQVTHAADLAAEFPSSPLAKLGGARSTIYVPMLKDDVLVGAIAIYRHEVQPFTEKQTELLKNFAAQAVIAIENARLVRELRQRTEEVVKLNQQLEQRVADQVGEIERMGRLRRFLPPQVADLIVASGTEKQLESHRREVTALFCDLRGFTGFSESSDPEDVMALLAEYHAAIGTIINKYSGTLERYAGDGVMVIFNDPVPVENPALQAVLMALEMRAAIGGLIERWRDLGHDLGFGIGIAHGFATLGTIGFEGRRDYAAIGTVSNVASRLCDEAKPGQILISPRVRQAIEKAVTVDSVGEFELKGIRRPMMAYNVLEALSSKPN